MSGPESNVSAWLRKAEHDLLNIENNLAAKDIPWDTVCFHAQQAAEKILKAFLISRGCDLSKTHDLVVLLTRCVECEAGLTSLESDCRKLTSYGVAARYPDDLFEPGEADGRDVVEAAYRVRTKVLALLSTNR